MAARVNRLQSSGSRAAADCDVLFAGGRIVDGSGAPAFVGDVCVRGDRIAAMGTLANLTVVRRVDATGLVVSPGFIDLLGQSEYLIDLDNRAASKIARLPSSAAWRKSSMCVCVGSFAGTSTGSSASPSTISFSCCSSTHSAAPCWGSRPSSSTARSCQPQRSPSSSATWRTRSRRARWPRARDVRTCARCRTASTRCHCLPTCSW